MSARSFLLAGAALILAVAAVALVYLAHAPSNGDLSARGRDAGSTPPPLPRTTVPPPVTVAVRAPSRPPAAVAPAESPIYDLGDLDAWRPGARDVAASSIHAIQQQAEGCRADLMRRSPYARGARADVIVTIDAKNGRAIVAAVEFVAITDEAVRTCFDSVLEGGEIDVPPGPPAALRLRLPLSVDDR